MFAMAYFIFLAVRFKAKKVKLAHLI